jgi:hypothetical protein
MGNIATANLYNDPNHIIGTLFGGLNLHAPGLSVDRVTSELQRRPRRLEECGRIVVGHGYRTAYLRNVTPLLAACVHQNWDVVKALIDLGADVNKADQDGYTALMRACRSGQTSVVDLLLTRTEIDVDAVTTVGKMKNYR